MPNGAQSMLDDESCAIFQYRTHIPLNRLLGFIVERTRRFIEDQNSRISNQCPRYGDALALPAG